MVAAAGVAYTQRKGTLTKQSVDIFHFGNVVLGVQSHELFSVPGHI
jgi:hypothetical protein